MNSNIQILPGVKRICWVECSRLPKFAALSATAGLPVAVLAEMNEVTFFGHPECRCVSTKENNGWKQTATLKFFSCEKLPFERNIAFIVTDVNDKNFIIGTQERPYPTVNLERVTGSPDGERAGFSYDISHEGLRSMIECLV